jgi:hypothetical protein
MKRMNFGIANKYTKLNSMHCECKYCNDFFMGIGWFLKHLKNKHDINLYKDIAEHLAYIPQKMKELVE